jgi:ABC-2 type transport system ATP-binding protein
MIIDHGKLLYDGDLGQLRQRFGGKRQLIVQFSENYPDASIPGATLTKIEAGQAFYEFDRQEISASELIGRLSGKFRIRDLEVREPDIETTVRKIYEEKLLE